MLSIPDGDFDYELDSDTASDEEVDQALVDACEEQECLLRMSEQELHARAASDALAAGPAAPAPSFSSPASGESHGAHGRLFICYSQLPRFLVSLINAYIYSVQHVISSTSSSAVLCTLLRLLLLLALDTGLALGRRHRLLTSHASYATQSITSSEPGRVAAKRRVRGAAGGDGSVRASGRVRRGRSVRTFFAERSCSVRVLCAARARSVLRSRLMP